MSYLMQVWIDDPIFVKVEYEGDYDSAEKKVRQFLESLHHLNRNLSIPLVQKAVTEKETQ